MNLGCFRIYYESGNDVLATEYWSLYVDGSHMIIFCRTNQAKGFGILNLAWGIGSVTGPVISGLLAQPCKQYKMRNCPSVLAEHPFLLPCMSAAIFSIAGVIASLSFKETNPKFLRVSYKVFPQYVSLMTIDNRMFQFLTNLIFPLFTNQAPFLN